MPRPLTEPLDTYWPATCADLFEAGGDTPTGMNVDASIEAVLLLADSYEIEYNRRAMVTPKHIGTL